MDLGTTTVGVPVTETTSIAPTASSPSTFGFLTSMVSSTSSIPRQVPSGDTASSTSTSDSTDAGSGSLPTSSIAGIAVGTSVGVLGMSLSAMFILLRRRRKQDSQSRLDARLDVTVPEQSLDRDTVIASPTQTGGQEPFSPVELGDQRLEPKELAADSLKTVREELEGDCVSPVSPIHPLMERQARANEEPIKGVEQDK